MIDDDNDNDDEHNEREGDDDDSDGGDDENEDNDDDEDDDEDEDEDDEENDGDEEDDDDDDRISQNTAGDRNMSDSAPFDGCEVYGNSKRLCSFGIHPCSCDGSIDPGPKGYRLVEADEEGIFTGLLLHPS